MTSPSNGVDEMLARIRDFPHDGSSSAQAMSQIAGEAIRTRASARPAVDGGASIFTPPDSDVTALGKEYLERRVACMTEAVDREQWRQEDGDARRPEYWVGRLHEAKIALNNLTQGLERRGDSFGRALCSTGERKPSGDNSLTNPSDMGFPE